MSRPIRMLAITCRHGGNIGREREKKTGSVAKSAPEYSTLTATPGSLGTGRERVGESFAEMSYVSFT